MYIIHLASVKGDQEFDSQVIVDSIAKKLNHSCVVKRYLVDKNRPVDRFGERVLWILGVQTNRAVVFVDSDLCEAFPNIKDRHQVVVISKNLSSIPDQWLAAPCYYWCEDTPKEVVSDTLGIIDLNAYNIATNISNFSAAFNEMYRTEHRKYPTPYLTRCMIEMCEGSTSLLEESLLSMFKTGLYFGKENPEEAKLFVVDIDSKLTYIDIMRPRLRSEARYMTSTIKSSAYSELKGRLMK